ncbi:DUF268 domain-containing protein [Acetatifactor muris]|uniref:Methyltransferase domain protein n=1 Tax=Acetatifactor muris TaxID=879566 RepID=A0A2K4ZG65_9FIRM|nr:DUF268 domain-containing protein [Acetatifactor muris]MCR2045717.1 DUF268 domain-containing protein [Acetatifactor muris]SOY29455.1 Methyltransferase domain protein [Acetatifactor muris]
MIQKERVIIWGIGQTYYEYKAAIEDKFDVVACTDKKFEDINELPFGWIRPADLNKYDYDRILITTSKYYDDIKMQLVKCGIYTEKIIGVDVFNERSDETQRYGEIVHDVELYKEKSRDELFLYDCKNLKIITSDKYMSAGKPSTHYFAQDIWGGKKIYQNNPKEHYDIGSRLDGFIAHLLIFREVNYIDIRPLPFDIPNLHFIQSDATQLEQFKDNSVESISSFHALEHFGLGRYGDEIDPAAYRKVIKNMQRIIKPGGHIYIGVPVGPSNKLIFNAHRIFAIKTIIRLFHKMTLQDIAIVKDQNAYAESIKECEYDNVGEYWCGLFEFVKKDIDL